MTASVLPTSAVHAQEGDRQTVSQLSQGLWLLLVFSLVPRALLPEVGSAGQLSAHCCGPACPGTGCTVTRGCPGAQHVQAPCALWHAGIDKGQTLQHAGISRGWALWHAGMGRRGLSSLQGLTRNRDLAGQRKQKSSARMSSSFLGRGTAQGGQGQLKRRSLARTSTRGSHWPRWPPRGDWQPAQGRWRWLQVTPVQGHGDWVPREPCPRAGPLPADLRWGAVSFQRHCISLGFVGEGQ